MPPCPAAARERSHPQGDAPGPTGEGAPHRSRLCVPLGEPVDLRVEERQRGDGRAVPPLDPLDFVVCLERGATGPFRSVDRRVLEASVEIERIEWWDGAPIPALALL